MSREEQIHGRDADEATGIAGTCGTAMAGLSGEQRSMPYQEPRNNDEHNLDACNNGIEERPSSFPVPLGDTEKEIAEEGSEAAPKHWTWFHVRNLVLLATCFALGWAAVFVQVGHDGVSMMVWLRGCGYDGVVLMVWL